MVLHADVYGRPKFRLRLSWLFGLVSKEVTKGKKKPEEKKKVAEGKRKLRRRGSRVILRILRTKGLLRQLKRLLKDVISRLNIRNLVVNLKIGLDNPADTGLLFALIGPVISFLNLSLPHEIRVQPSFGDEAVFEGYSCGRLRLLPIQLVMPFLKFAFSLSTIRVVKTLVLTKWKRKK